MVDSVGAPRPLPSAPCLTYAGMPVRWDRWEPGLRVLCASVDQSCPCGHPGPQLAARGVLDVPESTGEVHVPVARTGRARRRWVTRVETRPAHQWWRLMASLCPACHRLDVLDLADEAGPVVGAEAVLCDGCDAACGVGVDLGEARANLVALGGWTAGDADWDLCPACNPGRDPAAPLRAAWVRQSQGT